MRNFKLKADNACPSETGLAGTVCRKIFRSNHLNNFIQVNMQVMLVTKSIKTSIKEKESLQITYKMLPLGIQTHHTL